MARLIKDVYGVMVKHYEPSCPQCGQEMKSYMNGGTREYQCVNLSGCINFKRYTIEGKQING